MRRLEAFALCVAVLCRMSALTAAPEPAVVVLAATSLADALRAAGDAHTLKTGQQVSFTFAGSSVLASRLEADVFLPADASSMDYADKRHLIDPRSRRDLLSNQLVLIAPADSPIQLKIAPGFALSAALGKGHLAIADPDAVAAGRYARYALISLGAWNSVTDRVRKIASIGATVDSVARGKAALGSSMNGYARRERRACRRRISGEFASAHRVSHRVDVEGKGRSSTVRGISGESRGALYFCAAWVQDAIAPDPPFETRHAPISGLAVLSWRCESLRASRDASSPNVWRCTRRRFRAMSATSITT